MSDEPFSENEVLAKAKELYENRRRYVRGRPSWDRLDPEDDYDMGMRGAAIAEARKMLRERVDSGTYKPREEKPTPSSLWRKNGEPDPHGNRYDCERSQLAMGYLTDDIMANTVFVDPSIANLTGAMDRIRWLSRALERASGCAGGCICPVGAEATCTGSSCPRRGHAVSLTRATQQGHHPHE